jgi:hypothetical protein
MLPEYVRHPFMNEDDSRIKKERKKETLLNRLLNSYTITSFYVRKEELPVLEEFKRIAKSEAGSRSFGKVLVKAMQEYNRRHSVGNPQLLITHYAKPEGPQPFRVLCTYCQGVLTEGKVFCQRKGTWIPGVSCYSCKLNRLRKK